MMFSSSKKPKKFTARNRTPLPNAILISIVVYCSAVVAFIITLIIVGWKYILS